MITRVVCINHVMLCLGYQAPRSQFRVYAEPQALLGDGGRLGVGLQNRDMSRTPTARVHPLLARPGRAASRVVDKAPAEGRSSPRSKPRKIGSLGLPVSPARTRHSRAAPVSSKLTVTEDQDSTSSASSSPEKKTHKREGSLVLADDLPREVFGVEVGFDGDAEDSGDTEVALDVVSLDAVSLEAITLDSSSPEAASVTEPDLSNAIKSGKIAFIYRN